MGNNIQLQQSVQQGVASLLDDNVALRKIQNLIHNIKREEKDVMTEAEREEILNDIKNGVKEVNLAKQGKVKLKSAREFLNEIRN